MPKVSTREGDALIFGSMPLLGIDIGPSAIKLCELAGTGSVRKLRALGLELLPDDIIATDGHINDAEALENAIKSLLRKLHIAPAGRRVSASIPVAASEVKRVLLEGTGAQIEEVARIEAEQYFQGDINDLYFQFSELEEWSEDSRKRPVLLVGAKRNVVDQYVDTFKACGLGIGVLDCEPLCLSNAYFFNEAFSTNLTALVDVGSISTLVTIVYRCQVLYTRSVAIGAHEYTRTISQNSAVDLAVGETMKIAASLQPQSVPDAIQACFHDINQSLATEIHHAIKQYFESAIPIPGTYGLSQLILSGGGSRLLGLRNLLEQILQVPVQIMNPFSKVQINARKFSLDYITTQGATFGIAVGLALREYQDARS